MSSLAELPELTGFFSYSREDDEDAKGALSALRDRISRELRGQLGRSRSEFNLWQDKVAIAHGAEWEDAIKDAIAQSVFFIPIVTPSTLRSSHCKYEFDLFLAREAELDRRDLIFPIHYIRVPALEDERQWRQNDVLNVVGRRQYLDWTPMRFLDIGSPEAARQVESFCANIYRALQQPWLTPQQRREKAAEAERRRIEAVAEEERSNAAAKAAEDERRRIDAAEKAATAEAAEEQQRKAAVALAAEEERSKAAAKAAEDERHRIEAAGEERRKAAVTQEERRRTQAADKTAAATVTDEAPRAPEIAAVDMTNAAEAPDGLHTTAMISPSATWSDVKSWPYPLIAAVTATLGFIASFLRDTMGLYGVYLGNAYLVNLQRPIYVAVILFLVAKSAGTPGILRLVVLFFGMYALEFATAFTQNFLEGSMLGYLVAVVASSILALVEWLFLAANFFSLRDSLKDQKMLALAAAAGAADDVWWLLLDNKFLPSELTNGLFAAFLFGVMAVIFTYGIRRQQSTRDRAELPAR